MRVWPVVAAALGLAATAVLLLQPPPATPRDRVVPAVQADPARLSVVAFGTSLTRRALWPDRLAALLEECGFPDVAVTVRGEPGAGSAEGLAMIAGADVASHDLALIEFAVNDADIVDGVSRGTSLANHRAMIASLRERHPGIAVLLLTTNPVTGLHRLKRPRLMAYGDLYPRLAVEEGTSLFDGTARWAEGVPAGALPDGLHPDPAVEAALYAPALAGIVARIFGRSCAP